MRRFPKALLPRGRGLYRATKCMLLFGVAFLASATTPRALHARINKEKAYLATMRADLRNLITAQEMFFEDSSRYATSIEELTTTRYQTSSGVQLTTLAAHTNGFSARASYPGGTFRECWIDFGPFPDGRANEFDGEPQCTPAPIDEGRVFLAVMYAVFLLVAIGMRWSRAGDSLPPVSVPFVVFAILLAAVHPFWSGYRTESSSCLGTPGFEWLSVCIAAFFALRTSLRDDEDWKPPRPA